MRFLFIHFAPSLGGVAGRIFDSILNLNILLGASEDVSHIGDLVFHQVLVDRIDDLQPTSERDGSHIVIIVIHQSHLVMKITDILLENLPRLHFDGEEVVAFFLAHVGKRIGGRMLVSPPQSSGEMS